MSEPIKITITTEGKPNLDHLMRTDPKMAREVMETFVELMEEACSDEGGIPWYQLPQLFGGGLTFRDLVKGILHGSLDCREINPDTFDALKEEVHPLSMLMGVRPNYLDGGKRYFDWRYWFKLPDDVQVNKETVEAITRKLWRYAKYVKIEDLARALMYNQIKTYEGLGERNVKLLPLYPALRYQEAKFGKLHVGTLFDEVGALDCGYWMSDKDECPACQGQEMWTVGKYKICPFCRAGFKEESL